MAESGSESTLCEGILSVWPCPSVWGGDQIRTLPLIFPGSPGISWSLCLNHRWFSSAPIFKAKSSGRNSVLSLEMNNTVRHLLLANASHSWGAVQLPNPVSPLCLEKAGEPGKFCGSIPGGIYPQRRGFFTPGG